MRHALALAALLLSGCPEGHTPPPADGGVSRFAGDWLVDAPAAPDRTSWEMAPDGRLVVICNSELDPDAPTIGRVVRTDDMRECDLTGPWVSRVDGEVAIDTFCDDSLIRTAVFYVTWEGDTPVSFELAKVDGEETWAPWIDWRWQRCPPAECGFCL